MATRSSGLANRLAAHATVMPYPSFLRRALDRAASERMRPHYAQIGLRKYEDTPLTELQTGGVPA